MQPWNILNPSCPRGSLLFFQTSPWRFRFSISPLEHRVCQLFVLLHCLVSPLVLFSSGSPGPMSPMAMVDMAGRSRRRKKMRRTACTASHALHREPEELVSHAKSHTSHSIDSEWLRSVLKFLGILEVSVSGCFSSVASCPYTSPRTRLLVLSRFYP